MRSRAEQIAERTDDAYAAMLARREIEAQAHRDFARASRIRVAAEQSRVVETAFARRVELRAA